MLRDVAKPSVAAVGASSYHVIQFDRFIHYSTTMSSFPQRKDVTHAKEQVSATAVTRKKQSTWDVDKKRPLIAVIFILFLAIVKKIQGNGSILANSPSTTSTPKELPVPTKVNPGCGAYLRPTSKLAYLRPNQLGYEHSYGLDTYNSPTPHWRPYSKDEFQSYQEVQACTQNIKLNAKWSSTTLIAVNPMLECEEDDGNITTELLNSIKKYQRIWFVGDSILGQQFNAMQCMLDPNSTTTRSYIPQSQILHFNHSSNSISIISDSTRASFHPALGYSNISGVTILERVSWGWKFDSNETKLYNTSFPSLIESATEHDAIILDGGAHYNHERMDLMEKALRFIAEQSTKTKAAVFYMEPTPEEWKSSNGMFHGNNRGATCHVLTQDKLVGHSNKKPGWSLNQLSERSAHVINKLYPNLTISNTTQSLPAYWRSDLARSVFLDSTDHNVKFVPTFWQLVLSNETSNCNGSDCTHKSLSASIFMNLQLLRAMM